MADDVKRKADKRGCGEAEETHDGGLGCGEEL
jgi:hypothetical protein